jgi:hypothetical protein
MPTKSDEAAKDLYQSIMVEVMIRAYSINTATNTPTTIPQALIREYCFLQLRMLCELIALGCLVAHGDITKTKYFQKAYKGDDILQRLEKLHPDFFSPVSWETARPSSDSDPTLMSGRSPGMIVPMRTAIGSMPRTVRSGGVSSSFPRGDRLWLRRMGGRVAPVSSVKVNSTQVSAGTHAWSGLYCAIFGIGVTGESRCAVGSPPSSSADTQHSKSPSAVSGSRCGRSISPVSAHMIALTSDVFPEPLRPSNSVKGEENSWT